MFHNRRSIVSNNTLHVKPDTPLSIRNTAFWKLEVCSLPNYQAVVRTCHLHHHFRIVFYSEDEDIIFLPTTGVDSSWNVMAHGDARGGGGEGGNWRIEWIASTLHTTSEHGVSSITTADAHTSAASKRLNWRPRRFKWTRLFRRKTKSGFCACAITFQLVSAYLTNYELPYPMTNNSCK